MTTAQGYLEKTAKPQPFTAAGFRNAQEAWSKGSKKGSKLFKETMDKTNDSIKNSTKGVAKLKKKTKKKINKLKGTMTRNSLLAGGGAGFAGGAVGHNMTTSKDDSV